MRALHHQACPRSPRLNEMIRTATSSYSTDAHTSNPTGHMKQDKNETTLGLSPAQVAGSALAAVSGALLASLAGVTGTIIGAAVGSVVATVGASTYTWSLRRTSDVVRRTAAQVRQTALVAGPLPRSVADGPLRPEEDVAGTSDPARDQTDPGRFDEEAADKEAADTSRRSLPWGKVLLASAGVTVAALGGITAVESITGQPVSSWSGNSSSQGTSVGELVSSETERSAKDSGIDNSDDSTKDDTTTRSETPSPTPATTPVPSTGPSTDPSTSSTDDPSTAPDETDPDETEPDETKPDETEPQPAAPSTAP